MERRSPPSANYHSWMPSLDARYKLKSNWSVYAQFAERDSAQQRVRFEKRLVAVLPKPTTVKTYQAGSVVKFNRVTLDVDGYYSHFQNPYLLRSTLPPVNPL